ncbi:hypothetical protein BKA65DRAFT_477500 [Rhexocercosporidium sp. MPI-PUGE-AT-0058]|nr:hypothetical protein BKA65DRAFT_477500 [Rhexocercosporidium sp. MPI-PUGE-AT-0058]
MDLLESTSKIKPTKFILRLPTIKITSRINQDDGGFYIPSQIYHRKDFIDTTYQASASSTDQTSVSTILYKDLIDFLKRHTYDPPLLPNPHLHQTDPGILTLPLWRQPSTWGTDLLSYWPALKAFLRNFRPCIDAAGEVFKQFRPDDYAHMMLYHDHLIRSNLVSEDPGSRHPVWEDGYRTPFATMQVSVNGDTRGKVRRVGTGEHASEWCVVMLLGDWVGGKVTLLGRGEVGGVQGFESGRGDVWVLREGWRVGLEEFVGERVVVEFFVPVVGWVGEDGDDEHVKDEAVDGV